MSSGTLFIVATPIGNRADITERAKDILAEVDLIAAEDTRHSRSLLQYYHIQTPLVAYHDHNEALKAPVLIEQLQQGQNIALISDAGTPLVSDPGYRLVKEAHEKGIRVSPVPGVCAAIAALSVSGIATDRYRFEGFTPARSAARRAHFETLVKEQATLVFYESCHRITASLLDMVDVFGGHREALLAREMTKSFETVRKASLNQLLELVSGDLNQQKGEFVIIVQGVVAEVVQSDLIEVDTERLMQVLLEVLPVRQASEISSKISGIKKNKLYKLALKLKSSD
ncbi:MAG: 16S rRNA (cytidine(1402)-2'-O)-methyltransferase [Gammaproteobacteria bacterium]|nr:16S rRNA (cytidine(1402)-2'-O)-methyltransferase [Gammaproteobacteria bacterium]